jgi:hypothetical protein
MQIALFLIVTVTAAACSDAPVGRAGSGGNDSTSEVTGEAGGPCYPNGTCNAGLVCMADRCETDGATVSDSGTVDTDNAGGDTGTMDAADGGSDTGTVDTSTPPVEETVGPEGGVIEFGEIRLTIPPGALSAATPITISYAEQQAVAGYSPYTALYRFEPAGTRFQLPATVSARFTGDSGRATLFWTPDGGTGFERRGGRVGVDGRLEDQITHFSEGFVGDGVTYTDLSDRSCVVTRLVEGRNATPAGINGGLALFFTVDDCQGRPVTGLTAADFSLLEDGRPLSSEAQATILPADGRGIFVSLVLDFSASTEPVLPELLDGAAAFLDALEAARLPAQVQIMAFGGEATAYVAQAYTLDLAAARTALSELAAWRPSDIGATNLHGAVVQALGESEAAQAAFRARNLGGAFSTGYVVVFTDGGDTAERVNRAQVQSAVSASADEVFMVGLRGADYDAAALTAITSPQNVLAAPSAAEIEREFAALANRLAGQALSTYLLGYCSPKRAGSHTVSVQVTGAENRSTASFSFGADGFDGSCRASAFETICDGNDCGGLGCGACDDRTSECGWNGNNFVCQSNVNQFVAIVSSAAENLTNHGFNPGPDIDAVAVKSGVVSSFAASVAKVIQGRASIPEGNLNADPAAAIGPNDAMTDITGGACDLAEGQGYFSLGYGDAPQGIIILAMPNPITDGDSILVYELGNDFCSNISVVREDTFEVYVGPNDANLAAVTDLFTLLNEGFNPVGAQSLRVGGIFEFDIR